MALALKINLPASLSKEDVEDLGQEGIDKVLKQHGESLESVETIDHITVDPLKVFKEEVQEKLKTSYNIYWDIDNEKAHRLIDNDENLEALEQESLTIMGTILNTGAFFVASGIIEILALPKETLR